MSMWSALWWLLALVWFVVNIKMGSASYGLYEMPLPAKNALKTYSNTLKEYKITYEDQSSNPAITSVSLICEEGVGVGIPGNLFRTLDSSVLGIELGTLLHFENYRNPKTGNLHTMSLRTNDKVFFTLEDTLVFYKQKGNLIALIGFFIMALIPLFFLIKKTFLN